MDIDVKKPKYLSCKVYKWWYGWMIFSNDKIIYVESNGKKLDDGIKESESEWKMVFPQGLYIHEDRLKRIKHFKLLIMYCMIWKNG